MRLCKECGEPIISPTGANQKRCNTCLSSRTLPRPCISCGTIMEKPGALQKKCRPCQRASRAEACSEIGRRNYQGSGPSHHSWKTGIGTFTQHRKDICERCGSTEYLCAHHRDEDRTNNAPENIETLCKKCHQNHHKVGSSPKFKAAMKKLWASEDFRRKVSEAVSARHKRKALG